MWTPSPDFWAGYLSGAAGILIGNPLDVLKVRLQAHDHSSAAKADTSVATNFKTAASLIRGVTGPLIGYGALNALLFVIYNRSLSIIDHRYYPDGKPAPYLWTTFVAGALGGLASWPVSCPTELVKCRVQQPHGDAVTSSMGHIKATLRSEGIRGFYVGGVVTALRDSIGYGFYFWSYEMGTRLMLQNLSNISIGPIDRFKDDQAWIEAAKVLFCGGMAGVICWASIFPLDVIKTRVQTQKPYCEIIGERAPLLGLRQSFREGDIVEKRRSTMEVTRILYKTGGFWGFWTGIGICSGRAFIVNAASWAVYEYVMRQLDPDWRKKSGGSNDKMAV